jgi:hypothetical protein
MRGVITTRRFRHLPPQREDADQQELFIIFGLIKFLMLPESLTIAVLLPGMNGVKFLAGSRRFLALHGGDLEE